MEQIISHEHKCRDCEYGYWAPKRWGSGNCYICTNPDSWWKDREINGHHIFTCEKFNQKRTIANIMWED